MKKLKNVKVFDTNNPNFKFALTRKEVEKQLIGVPVVIHTIGNKEEDFALDNVIGFITKITPSPDGSDETSIYGEVNVFKKGVKPIGEFVNYMVDIDPDSNIVTDIVGIAIR